MAAIPTGLRITQIKNQKAGSRNLNDEYVVIANDGDTKWRLEGWLVTDETDQQLRPHIYTFPSSLTGGSGWSFEPGEVIYLMTGPGDDIFFPSQAERRAQFHFHWCLHNFVWNNTGDRVYLRHPDGTWATQPFPIP